MLDQVWLLTDKTTGDVSYIRHGREGDEAHWCCIGPFAFTTRAAALAATVALPQAMPQDVKDDFGILEVETASFIRAIYNGFLPRLPDVIVLDQVLLPLTERGGTWVDDVLDTPFWASLYDTDGEGAGLDWLDRVLELVAAKLDASMETIQAIGALNAIDEDTAVVEPAQDLVKQHVQIALTPEHGTLCTAPPEAGAYSLEPEARFWMHTMGLAKLGRPELEIREVPARWVLAAGNSLIGLAAYSLEHGIVPGETLTQKGPLVVSLQATTSPDPFWQGHATGCLQLAVTRVLFLVESDDVAGPYHQTIH